MEARKQFHCHRSLPLASEEALDSQVNPIRSLVGYFSLRSAAPLRMSTLVIDKVKRVLPVDHDRCWLGLLHQLSTAQAGTRSISVGTGSPPQSSGGSFAAKSVLAEDGSGMGASTCSFARPLLLPAGFHSEKSFRDQLERRIEEGFERLGPRQKNGCLRAIVMRKPKAVKRGPDELAELGAASRRLSAGK